MPRSCFAHNILKVLYLHPALLHVDAIIMAATERKL